MDPYSYQSPQTPTPEKEWFDAITTEPIQHLPPSPEHSKKKLIVIILVALVLILGSIGSIVVYSYYSRPLCLTDEDYVILAGTKPGAQLSPQNFYTQSIEFNYATNSYTNDSKSAKELIDTIATLYRDSGDNKSIIITLSSDYMDEDTKQMADARTAILKAALVDAGVNDSAISITEPTSLAEIGDIAEEFDQPTVSYAYISVASIANCR